MFEFKTLIHYIPFLGMAAVGRQEINYSTLITRLLEAAIIAGVVMYSNIQVMDTRIGQINNNVSVVNKRADKLDGKIEKLERKLNTIILDLKIIKYDLKKNDKLRLNN